MSQRTDRRAPPPPPHGPAGPGEGAHAGLPDMSYDNTADDFEGEQTRQIRLERTGDAGVTIAPHERRRPPLPFQQSAGAPDPGRQPERRPSTPRMPTVQLPPPAQPPPVPPAPPAVTAPSAPPAPPSAFVPPPPPAQPAAFAPPARWQPPAAGFAPPAPPSITIGQKFSLKPSDTPPPLPPAPPVLAEPAAAQPAARPAKTRVLELLWAASDAEPRARLAPLLAEAFGPAPKADEPAGKQEASRRAVHRAIARAAAAEDLEYVMWNSVDDDGVFEPPIVVVGGELELLFADAELAQALVPVLRPFAEGNGELGERIESAANAAERSPEASGLVARALTGLRRAWGEHDVPTPFDELEADARRALVLRRKFRTLDIFQGTHVTALLRTAAHPKPVPVYLPEEARSRLPLDHRFEARLLVQVSPRQVADEPCPLAAAALAIARVIRS